MYQTISVTTENGMSNAPTPEFCVGDKLSVMDNMELNAAGQLRSVPVTYVEITSVSAEYVVPEAEWYIAYRIKHVAPDGTTLSTETVTYEDIQSLVDENVLSYTDKTKDELLTEHQSHGIDL